MHNDKVRWGIFIGVVVAFVGFLGAIYVFYNPLISDLSGRMGMYMSSLKYACYTKQYKEDIPKDEFCTNYSESVVFFSSGGDEEIDGRGAVEGVIICGKTNYNLFDIKWHMSEKNARENIPGDFKIVIDTTEVADEEAFIIAMSEERDMKLDIKLKKDKVEKIQLVKISDDEENAENNLIEGDDEIENADSVE